MTTATDIATREEVDDLKRQWALDPIFELIPSAPRFTPYADELREFEKTKNAEWEKAALDKEARWLKTHELNHCYQLELDEINRLIDGGFGFAIISTVVVPNTEEWGDMNQFERTSYDIIYTVQINGLPRHKEPIIPDIDSPELRGIYDE